MEEEREKYYQEFPQRKTTDALCRYWGLPGKNLEEREITLRQMMAGVRPPEDVVRRIGVLSGDEGKALVSAGVMRLEVGGEFFNSLSMGMDRELVKLFPDMASLDREHQVLLAKSIRAAKNYFQ